MMDSNNFVDNAGVGEREARVFSRLVYRRYWGLAHGIGRSGDIAAEQPKAAGSSLLAKLSTLVVTDAMQLAGLEDLGRVALLPLATGMALTMTLLSVKAARPHARYVIWPRIDQKTCLKAIVSAGLEPVVVENVLEGDELRTDLPRVEALLQELGPDSVACVCSTTSCFAPRGPDRLVELALLCKQLAVPHVVNNAYGVQSRALCAMVTAAWRRGRVDAIVQSTDKNFMVPVGGAVLAAPRSKDWLVTAVCKAYPGRASAAAHLDMLITLLQMGAEGWTRLLQEREELFGYLQGKLQATAAEHGERVLCTPSNPISMAMTLSGTDSGSGASSNAAASAAEEGRGGASARQITFVGSMLWARSVSGTRVVATGKRVVVGGMEFSSYGAHCDSYPHAYLTAAAAVGTTRADVDTFCTRLGKTLLEFRRKYR